MRMREEVYLTVISSWS